MAGSTWTPWSKGAERRESKADVHFILTDCFLLRFELMMQLSVCHSGRAWICYTWHGRKLCSWTKRRARIFSESSVTVFWSFSTLNFRTTQILFTTCYRVPKGLLVFQGSMELLAYLANQDHQGHQEYLLR